MKKNSVRVMLIGLDAPIVSRVLNFVQNGHLPAIQRLIERGVCARHCLAPYPTITPPNWTTIVTGAWPGTHGVTDFNIHLPGDPLYKIHQGFDSRDCQAEYIWTAAEKAGKSSVIVNYPTTWPPTIQNGVQLGGGGTTIDEWRFGVDPGDPRLGTGFLCDLCDDDLFTVEDYPLANRIKLRPAQGWVNVPKAAHSLEAELSLRFRRARIPVRAERWYLLALDSEGNGYDRILVGDSKDASKAFATLEPGEWSPVISREFETKEGVKQGGFRMKLLELSPSSRKLRLYTTSICSYEDGSYPPDVARKVKSKEGLPLPRGGYVPFQLGWIDLETLGELVDYAHEWLVDACTYLLAHQKWDLFFMHDHCPDWAYHTYSQELEPLINRDAEDRRRYEIAELHFYRSLDHMIGQLLKLADDDTLVIITSDHGAKAKGIHFNVGKVLEKVGLTKYTETKGGKRIIDWSQTKAVAQRSCYVYINMKGRDPDGIVEPGQEYEELQDQIIHALYDYVDTETASNPVSLALKKRDARLLGLYGDRIGDVVYALHPAYSHEHGPFLPTASYGIGAMDGLFIMAGPGVKKGYTLERTVWLTDVVPTICHLADLPIPAHAEGAILYQALEEPNAKLNELLRLRDNYARLQRAVESNQAMTHTYYIEGNHYDEK